jgi:mRNA interferase RelE/StbE
MKYVVLYTKTAIQDLRRLPKQTTGRIVDKISFFRQQPDPFRFAKKLVGYNIGQYRFRIGEYRAIFDVDQNGQIKILMILRIKHRKDIYNL